MNDNKSFQRFVGIAALVGIVLNYTELVNTLNVINFDVSAWTDQAKFFEILLVRYPDIRWSHVASGFGFMLLDIPMAIFLWKWLGKKSPNFSLFYTVLGIGSVLIGSSAQFAFTIAIVELLKTYPDVSPVAQEAHYAMYLMLNAFIPVGIWGIFNSALNGLWLTGMGNLLRTERAKLGWGLLVVGVFRMLGSVGYSLGIDAFSQLSQIVYLFGMPLWAAIMGITLLRSPVILDEA